MKIRTAAPSEVPDINNIKILSDRFCFGANYPARPLAKQLTDNLIQKGFLIVADNPSTSEISGFLAYDYCNDGKTIYIEQISVAPIFQRKGVATHLMQSLIDGAHEKKIIDIGLTTDTEAVWSMGLYSKLGFSIVAEDQLSEHISDILEKERSRGLKNRAYLSLTL
jgi:ribosomal protein S18 acetylase RimI-like enzyme